MKLRFIGRPPVPPLSLHFTHEEGTLLPKHQSEALTTLAWAFEANVNLPNPGFRDLYLSTKGHSKVRHLKEKSPLPRNWFSPHWGKEMGISFLSPPWWKSTLGGGLIIAVRKKESKGRSDRLTHCNSGGFPTGVVKMSLLGKEQFKKHLF